MAEVLSSDWYCHEYSPDLLLASRCPEQLAEYDDRTPTLIGGTLAVTVGLDLAGRVCRYDADLADMHNDVVSRLLECEIPIGGHAGDPLSESTGCLAADNLAAIYRSIGCYRDVSVEWANSTMVDRVASSAVERGVRRGWLPDSPQLLVDELLHVAPGAMAVSVGRGDLWLDQAAIDRMAARVAEVIDVDVEGLRTAMTLYSLAALDISRAVRLSPGLHL